MINTLFDDISQEDLIAAQAAIKYPKKQPIFKKK